MDPNDFHSSNAGKVIQTLRGYYAFLPAPLPPELVYDSQLVLALSKADTSLSELSGLGRHLPNPHLLIAPYIRREAVLSSRIEGTKAGLPDLWMVDVGGIEKMIRIDFGMRQGTYLLNGTLTKPYIGEYFTLPYQDIELLLAAFR